MLSFNKKSGKIIFYGTFFKVVNLTDISLI
jgi:hypothetical protein